MPAEPVDLAGEAEAFGLRRQLPGQRTAADMGQAPRQVRRQLRQRGQQIFVTFLFDQAADRSDCQRCRRIRTSDRGTIGGMRRKPVEIEAVIVQVDFRLVALRRQVAQMVGAVGGAGGQPPCVVDFFLLLPRRNGPDILGVRRNRERYIEHRRRVAGNRRRRVQEMGV